MEFLDLQDVGLESVQIWRGHCNFVPEVICMLDYFFDVGLLEEGGKVSEHEELEDPLLLDGLGFGWGCNDLGEGNEAW